MKRWMIRLLAGAGLLVVIVFLLAWATLRASLPQLDGELAVEGIAAVATIERDVAADFPSSVVFLRQLTSEGTVETKVLALQHVS